MSIASCFRGLGGLLVLGLIIGGVASEFAEAGKPASGTQKLSGNGGYVATPLFDSAVALAAVRGEDAWNPVTGYVSMSDAYDLRLTYGLEVDDGGALYANFRADGAVTGGSNFFTGVVRYDPDTTAVEVVLARSTYYEDLFSESNQGEFIHTGGMDRVPELASSAPNATDDLLQSGDIVLSRWTDTTDISDPNSPVADDRNEIVLFRADTTGQLVEERILYTFENLNDGAGISVAADCFGNVYLWLTKPATADAFPTGLYRLSYDAASEDYGLTQLTFPFEISGYFDTDDAGNLYVHRVVTSGDQVIYQLAPGDDPQADAVPYATYSDFIGDWTADNAAVSGALAMHLRAYRGGSGLVDRVEPASSAEYADRIAESESVSYGITADASGSVYIAHEDREFISRTEYVVSAYTIYRLEFDASSGGGGGGGKGGGKGKNK